MYKLVFKIVDVEMSNFFTLRNNAVPTRGNPYKVSFFHGANGLYME